MGEIGPVDMQARGGAYPPRHVILVGGGSGSSLAGLADDPAIRVRHVTREAVEKDSGQLVGADLVVWYGTCDAGSVAVDIVDRARRGLFVLIIVLPVADLDGWGFALGEARVAFVIAGDEGALMNEVGRALHPDQPIVAENADAARRLAELGDEVARIAATLTGRKVPGGGIADRRLPFAAEGPPERQVTAALVRSLIRARRLRDRHFPGLFADPAWDILLDLLAARLERVPVAVSSLCIAAGVPPTTALRWIGGMTEQGLLRREADPEDRRRVFITLSDEAAKRVETCVRAIMDTGLPVT